MAVLDELVIVEGELLGVLADRDALVFVAAHRIVEVFQGRWQGQTCAGVLFGLLIAGRRLVSRLEARWWQQAVLRYSHLREVKMLTGVGARLARV